MENLNNLYKHSMTHPIVADAYIEEKEDLPTQILINEVPDTSVQAHMDFNPEPPAPTKYNITTQVSPDSPEGSGAVDGGGEYDEGATATLTATATTGYVFVKWNDENTDNPRTITVTGDAIYTATFAAESPEEGNGTNTTNTSESGQQGEANDQQEGSELEENGEVSTLDSETPKTNGE